MAVFLRHRFAGGVKTTIWKKYKVTYSNATVTYSIEVGTSIRYYDGLTFPADGSDPTLVNGQSGTIAAPSAATTLPGKLMVFGTSLSVGANTSVYDVVSFDTRQSQGYINFRARQLTRATARSLAIAGDYIEDVESEDPNAYPDNGPLGLYFYIKQ